MTRTFVALAAGLAVALGAVPSHPRAAGAAQSEPTLPTALTAPTTSAAAAPARALVDKYCLTCHSARTKSGGFVLQGVDLEAPAARAETWEKVIRKVRGGMMPPVGLPHPDKAALDAFAAYLETSIDTAAAARPVPGRTVLHRLNRAEYGNAVRDLLALDVDVASLLPADDSAYGFDNIGDVLGVSPMLMERYLSAAWKVSGLAVGNAKATPTVETFRVRSDLSQNDHIEGLPIGTRGGILIRYTFPVDGEYVIQPRLYRETVNIIRGLEVAHDLEVSFDGDRVLLARFGGAEDEKANYLNPTAAGDALETRFKVRIPVKAGPHFLGVAFVKKSSAPSVELLQPFLRERIDPITPVGIPEVDKVTIEGPFNVTGAGNSPSRRAIFSCKPSAASEEAGPASAVASARSRRSSPENDASEGGCARTILTTLARRAYRRPPSPAEVDRLMGFFNTGRKTGGAFDAGIENALAFMLVSPQFLYRFERDPEQVPADGIYRLTDLELASRLSFFIWSSIPDDQLLNLAVAGKLRSPAVLDQQVKRMLADERARALGANFAGQWLYLRNLKSLRPDEDVFPDFDDNLRQAMQRETELLFESIVIEDKSVLDLLDADYTFLNERLARHYGVPNIYGDQYRRVRVTNDYRRGLLGQGSILTLNSYGNRTSPVTRGKYVLSNILGTPPPEPPANVPPLDEKPGRALSMRERMEEHRANPACAGCHKLMDPIGLSLENFDGIGRWRRADGGARIDATSTLWDGTTVDGPSGLRRAILGRPEQFARTATEMLLTYALGRGLEYTDMPVVRSVVRESAAQHYQFSALVAGIVKSGPFQMRMKQGDR